MRDHARQLLEKHVRKPFFAAQYAGDFQRMDPEAVDAGLAWLDQRFHVIRYEARHAAGLHRALELCRLGNIPLTCCGQRRMTSCRLWTLCWTSRARLCSGAVDLTFNAQIAYSVPHLAYAAVPRVLK